MTEELELASQALAELDFTAQNAEIAEIQQSIRNNEEAIATAQARQAEIRSILSERTGPDGSAVADALLAVGSASIAAQATVADEDLKAESAALSAAIRELNERTRSATAAIKYVQELAFFDATTAAAPILQAEIARAKTAATALVSAYAGIEAIRNATRSGADTSDVLRKALPAVAGYSRIIPWSQSEPVPEHIREALAPLADKGPALPAVFATTIPMP